MKDGTQCIEKGECRGGQCVPYCETQGLQSCMCDTEHDACMRCVVIGLLTIHEAIDHCPPHVQD